MKRTLFAFLFLFPVLLSAQFRIVGTGLFTTVNDSTYRAKIDFRPDLTGFSYNPTQMNDSMYVLSQRGQLYRLDSFYNATFSSAFIVVVEKNGNWGSPVGQVMVFQNNSSLAAPQAVYGANGATAGMQAGVDTWNALLLKVVADSAFYWNEAYSAIVDSIWFSGTSTKTLNMAQRGGDTLTASFLIPQETAQTLGVETGDSNSAILVLSGTGFSGSATVVVDNFFRLPWDGNAVIGIIVQSVGGTRIQGSGLVAITETASENGGQVNISATIPSNYVSYAMLSQEVADSIAQGGQPPDLYLAGSSSPVYLSAGGDSIAIQAGPYTEISATTSALTIGHNTTISAVQGESTAFVVTDANFRLPWDGNAVIAYLDVTSAAEVTLTVNGKPVTFRTGITSVTAGYGLTGGTIDVSGTIEADTNILATKQYVSKYENMPFDSVTFNINEGDASEQELKYSADKGYLQYGGLDSVQIPLLPGIWYVRNDTSVTIPKGTVVRASGTLGASGRIKVKHMIANGSIPAMYVLGIAMQDIAVGADGYVMTQGKIRQVNTTAYSEGAVLYADVDTLGGLTQTEPGNGYLKLPIAFVVNSAANGTLAVRIDAGSSLRDLHDVDTTGRVNRSVLQYNDTLKYWKASTTAGIVAGDTSVFARDFQISGTSGQVTYFNGTNTVTGDANLTWSAANRTLGINTTTTSGANIIIKNTQEPVRDAAWLPQQTFGADTTNWTRGTGWTFNGTQAVATAATGALTYTTLPDTIISGRAYEVTYTLASYSAGTVTVAAGNASVALPAYNVTGNAILLRPTSATGGFRFTTSTFTGNLDNVAVAEVRNPVPILISGQDDNTLTLYGAIRMPNQTGFSVGEGGASTTGAGNVFIGSNAGLNNTTGAGNVFLGVSAGQANTTGSQNNFLGFLAGASNTSGATNNFFGYFAGYSNTTGIRNNFFGFESGRFTTTGSNNNFFGFQSGYANTTGTQNNFFGSLAGTNNTTASNNNYFGSGAGRFGTTASGNNFFGERAGEGNISGSGNNYIGTTAGLNSRGSGNNFIGSATGAINRTGSNNIFFGTNSGNNSTLADTLSGSSNTSIGHASAQNIASSAAGNLVLGNAVNLPTGNGSNQVVIKNLIFGTGASGTGTTIQTTAKAGINVNNPQSTLDIEGNMAIGATYSGTTAAPTNGLIVEGNTGIGTSSPQRRLHVTGTVRVDTLTRDVPTRIVGADADGDLGAVTLGTGLSIASGTLNGTDTTSLSNRINLKLNASDTTKYVKYADTSTTIATKANVALKLNISDTSVFARDWQIAGTANYLPKFTGASSVGDSPLLNPSGNKIMLGHTTANVFTTGIEVHSATSGTGTAQSSIDVYHGASGFADFTGRFQINRSRANTVGSFTKVNNGDWLGRYMFNGADGAKYVTGAQIYALTDATTGLDSMPTAMRFATNGGTTSQPTDRMSITSAGRVGIATTSPARSLHVEGEARISDLTTDTPTRIVGADADGDLGAITLGTGLSISSGTLNASGITSVYIPLNVFAIGDTLTTTVNSKEYFLVHSGLNGYCIDSYTVKAIAGTGTADIQLDKNGSGANLQAISGTTVYTKDTNIALVTGDYIRGQVSVTGGTLIGLGITLEIKLTCN